MDLPPILAARVGPFPVAGWVGIGAAGIGLGILIRRSSLFAGAPTPPAAPVDPAAEAIAQAGYNTTTAGLPGAFPTGNSQPPAPTGTPTAPATNLEWSRAAVAFLIARGVDPIIADSAIGNYLQGVPLDAPRSAALSLALAQLGQPPEGAPPVAGVTAPPPYLPAAVPMRAPAAPAPDPPITYGPTGPGAPPTSPSPYPPVFVPDPILGPTAGSTYYPSWDAANQRWRPPAAPAGY